MVHSEKKITRQCTCDKRSKITLSIFKFSLVLTRGVLVAKEVQTISKSAP